MAVAQASAMKVYALDRSPYVQVIIGKNLRDAGLEGKVIPLAGDVAKIPLADASVDLVVSRGSVYFWDDLHAAFCETARVLRPGGMAFIGGGFGNADLREQIVPAMAERKPGWVDFYRENMSEATTERLRQASTGIPGVTSEVLADDSGVWVVMRRGSVP
jgi:ubiquinone/menaquinone biosynthesis C-methylase UbiE